MEDYYALFGVVRTADDIVIKAVRSNLLQRYHPDKYSGDPAEALAKTTAINNAWDILSDPYKRKIYDNKLLQYQNEIDKKSSKVSSRSSERLSPKPTGQKKPSFFNKFFILVLLPIVFYLGFKFFYNRYEIYSLVITVNTYLRNFAIFSVLIFIVFSPSQPKKDRRFKTGYKNNATVKPIPKILTKLLAYSIVTYLISFGVLYMVKPTLNEMPELSPIETQSTQSVEIEKPILKTKQLAEELNENNESVSSPQAPEVSSEPLPTVSSEKIDATNSTNDNEKIVDPIESAQRLLSH